MWSISCVLFIQPAAILVDDGLGRRVALFGLAVRRLYPRPVVEFYFVKDLRQFDQHRGNETIVYRWSRCCWKMTGKGSAVNALPFVIEIDQALSIYMDR